MVYDKKIATFFKLELFFRFDIYFLVVLFCNRTWLSMINIYYIINNKNLIAMCNPKFRKEAKQKSFFGNDNRLIRAANRIISQLYGNNEERLAQFEMIAKSEQFQKKYPGLLAKDIAAIVRIELS